MATLLYRIGRFAFRNAWKVIGAWVLAARRDPRRRRRARRPARRSRSPSPAPSRRTPSTGSKPSSRRPPGAGEDRRSRSRPTAHPSTTQPYTRRDQRHGGRPSKTIDGVDSVVTPFSRVRGQGDLRRRHAWRSHGCSSTGPSTEVTPRTLDRTDGHRRRSARMPGCVSRSAARSSRTPPSASPSPRSSACCSRASCSSSRSVRCSPPGCRCSPPSSASASRSAASSFVAAFAPVSSTAPHAGAS